MAPRTPRRRRPSSLTRELDRIGRSWESRLLRIKHLAEQPDQDPPPRP